MLRRLFLFCSLSFIFCLSPLRAQWVPQPTNRLVNDYAHVLDPDEVATLEHRLDAFSDSTSNQILVIITPTLGGAEIMDVTQRIGESWGVGHGNHNNGLVILIKAKSASEPDGQVSIGTGYGLEGCLPDAVCHQIIDAKMIPRLAEGDYYGALDAALDVILPVAAHEYSFDEYVKKENRQSWLTAIGVLLVLAVFMVVLTVYNKRHPNNGGGSNGDSFGDGQSVPPSRPSWYSGWNTHSGGSSSWGGRGGFGGFGGGHFGGGGAHGRF